MAYLCTFVLLILPLISLYVQFAVSAGTGVLIGGACTNTTNCTVNSVHSECIVGKCQCTEAYYEQNKTCVARVSLGGTCTNTTNCTAGSLNSECKGGKCRCQVAFYQQNNKCIAKRALTTLCNATDSCLDDNAMCFVYCLCKNSFYKDTTNSATCKPRIYPNNTCGTPQNDSCVDNAYCDSTICVCGIGYTATTTSCNSAMTMAVVEISTIILCFMLSYIEVLK